MVTRGEGQINQGLSLREVTLRRGGRVLFKNISKDFSLGKAYLLTGENGSGKTSLLEVLAGNLRQTKGSLSQEPKNLQISYCAVEPFLYEELSVFENLKFFAELLGSKVLKEVSNSIEAWGLEKHTDYRISELSSGLVKRTSLARAFLGNPQMILVDEPLTFLDSEGVNIFKSKLRRFIEAGGGAIVASNRPLEFDFIDFEHQALRELWLEPVSQGTVSSETAYPDSSKNAH